MLNWVRHCSLTRSESWNQILTNVIKLENIGSDYRQLIMDALLHDLVDTDMHPSKLGCPITIPDPYVRWLCAQHHAAKEFSDNSDLQLLQAADVRTSRYARLLSLSTWRRKLAPFNTQQLT